MLFCSIRPTYLNRLQEKRAGMLWDPDSQVNAHHVIENARKFSLRPKLELDALESRLRELGAWPQVS